MCRSDLFSLLVEVAPILECLLITNGWFFPNKEQTPDPTFSPGKADNMTTHIQTYLTPNMIHSNDK